ncbi:MAG: YdaS family helix-turn-helix protein [Pseudomonadota bacterium]
MNNKIQKAIQIINKDTSSQRGGQSKLALACNVSRQCINNLLHEKTKPISANIAIAIEKATKGKMTRSQMRPDLWPRGTDH